MARIEPPGFASFPAVLAALDAAQGTTRLVGGCVRDALAGIAPKDIDLATRLSPEEVMARLAHHRVKAIPTGIAHGTITAATPDGPVEITTLRRDVATDGRRATVSYTDDWREDAERRDFTINALFADPLTGEVFDYFGGLDDLGAGIVRFIGAPLVRIAEDHLRILRFFRFHARFAKGVPHAESLAACVARANDLMALSRERIAMELLDLLALPDPAPTFTLMIKTGIWQPVIPEFTDAAPLARLVARETETVTPPDALRRLASLIPADARIAEDIANRLRLSKAQKKRLVSATGLIDAEPLALAYWIGIESAVDRLLLTGADPAPLSGWPVPAFPLKGGDVVQRGISAGPEVAGILREAERKWVAEHFPSKARAEAILDSLLGST